MNLESDHTFIEAVQLEYKKIDKQWLHLHYQIIIGAVCIGFAVEFILAFLFYYMAQQQTSVALFPYTLRYVFSPFLVNLGWLMVSMFAMRHPRLTDRTRVYLLSLSLIGICFVFYSVHYIFQISIIFFAPILFTAFYDRYRLTSRVTLLALIAKLLSDFLVYWDQNRLPPFDGGFGSMQIIVSTLLLLFFYAFTLIIIYFQRKKNKAVLQKDLERQEMQHELVTDSLTTINNRRALREILQDVEESASEDSYFFAMIDLDSFKKINDTLGHVAGDKCLTIIGQTLHLFSCERVTPFRFGGDEFCLLFKGLTIDEVAETCRQIQKKCSQQIFNELNVSMTISIGIAEHIENMFAEELIQKADAALYRAKKQKNMLAF